ncbi:MAG: HAD-IA family hydrolase [Gemmatimonadetes bacterium]|nr:HAD-IA family hydrolase [Gemmatimonadota bacterium]
MFYDTVIFDAAGTLVGRDSPDFFEEFFVVAAGELGAVITLDQVKAALSKAMEEPGFRKRDGRMSTPEQTRRYFLDLYAHVFDTAGIEGDLRPGLQQYYDRFQDGRYLDVYGDVRPALEALQAGGVRLGVLSNWSEHLALVLERHGLDRYFSFLVVSAEAGCEKPDEQIFRMAIDRAGTPIDRILYIGDYPEEDILPAERVGLDALLIDRYEKYGRYRLPSIRKLTDVPGLIGIS